MAFTLASLRDAVFVRMGDPTHVIWTADEIDTHLVDAIDDLATDHRLFWDWVYLDNLPRGFSATQTWERRYAVTAGFDYGVANYTFDDELRLLGDELDRIGPGSHTSPFEGADGYVARARGVPSIPATSELPTSVLGLDRGVWDSRGIDALTARDMSRSDSRYELTQGEVYGYLWQKDGIRTIRKVRVPAAKADTFLINGSWGMLRTPADLSGDTVVGTWGSLRRTPGHHPLGPDYVGVIRRPVKDGTNVRMEHWRRARVMTADQVVCELPDRYALYLRDYAQSQLYGRAGPGQDLTLAKHYAGRWSRASIRIAQRITRVLAQRVGVLGEPSTRLISRPPRPSLPWQYGSRVR